MAILRGVTYKAIRGKMLKQKSFLSLIVRFLYNSDAQKIANANETPTSVSERLDTYISSSASTSNMGRNRGRV